MSWHPPLLMTRCRCTAQHYHIQPKWNGIGRRTIGNERILAMSSFLFLRYYHPIAFNNCTATRRPSSCRARLAGEGVKPSTYCKSLPVVCPYIYCEGFIAKGSRWTSRRRYYNSSHSEITNPCSRPQERLSGILALDLLKPPASIHICEFNFHSTDINKIK